MTTPQTNHQSTSIQHMLFLLAGIFAVAAGLLVFLTTNAAAPEGVSPTSATELTGDVTKGHLDPGEQHWYKFTPTPGGEVVEIEKSLTMVFTPDNGFSTKYIGFTIFEEDQIQLYFEGDTSKMANFGTGNLVSRDGNPETGEYLWNGWVFGPKTYYVQVYNESDFPIDYWIFNDNVRNYDLGDSAETPTESEAAAPQLEVAAEPVEPDNLGQDPAHAEPLTAGLNRGTLPPNTTHWYSFQHTDPTGKEQVKELTYTMFSTPDNGDRRHHVNFELYSSRALEQAERGEIDSFDNFGAGTLIDRDRDENTIENTWSGFVNMGETYFLAVNNGSDAEIEYWLYDEDIYYPQLGPTPVPQPRPVFAPGVAPDSAMDLKVGLNKGSLKPDEERWYSFSRTDFDKETFEEMALTMVTTPEDGNRLRHMVFNVYTEEGVRAWTPDDNTNINNIGAGSVVHRDTNPDTGERFWQGWVLDNDKYFVQVLNGTDVEMDYWLYTGDVRSPELGEPTPPQPPLQAAPGLAPSNPIELEVKVTDDTLDPNQERWYVFSRGDVEDTGAIETTFTMIFTPDDGNRIRDINVEIFEESALAEWAPDNRFNIVPFGRGNVISRDGNPKTGEFIWNGYVLAHNRYFLRVSNESDTGIDYRIYPEDVIHTTLGE